MDARGAAMNAREDALLALMERTGYNMLQVKSIQTLYAVKGI